MISNKELFKKIILAVGLSNIIFYILFFPHQDQRKGLEGPITHYTESTLLQWSPPLTAENFPIPERGTKINIYNKDYQLLFEQASVDVGSKSKEDGEEIKTIFFSVPTVTLRQNLMTETSRKKFFNTPWYLVPYTRGPTKKNKNKTYKSKPKGLNYYAVEFYWKAL